MNDATSPQPLTLERLEGCTSKETKYAFCIYRVRLPNQAPTYFHWVETRPVTTNMFYGYAQRAIANKPHSAYPKGFFSNVRPFDVFGFYPDYFHDWDLSGRQCRSPPLRQWRPSRNYCLQVSTSIFCFMKLVRHIIYGWPAIHIECVTQNLANFVSPNVINCLIYLTPPISM
jgi:hypothetical protein